ncbi:MAG: hypothetical protein WCT18_04380 [Patescibacteria group bacterium]
MFEATPGKVNILPLDQQNSQQIIDRLTVENVVDPAKISAIMDEYKFSSPQVKKHFFDGFVYLIKNKALKEKGAGIHLDVE